MLDFTQEEIGLLVQDGYEASFMLDIREGDLVAIAPVTRTNFDGTPVPVKTLAIKRILKSDGAYWNQDTEELVPNTVLSFIGINLDGLPEHCMYGSMYPCFIKRIEQ